MKVGYEFGLKVKELREEQGLKQWELGEMTGMSQTKISAYEVGRNIPSIVNADKVLNALGYKLAIVKD